MQITADATDPTDVFTLDSERTKVFIDVQHKFNFTAGVDEFSPFILLFPYFLNSGEFFLIWIAYILVFLEKKPLS